MNCRFCKIITQNSKQIIRETDHTVTIPSNPKLMHGHLLVVPKRHIEKLSELTKEERADLFDETINVQEKVLETLAPGCDISQHFRPYIPGGASKITHIHIHIRPRDLDDELYQKVQARENDVFTDTKENELEEYKNLFRG
jgi:diadenosine tetraphosphate (Ap4A) HIT family hydrolase